MTDPVGGTIPFAHLEPQAGLLQVPPADQVLVKVMKAEHFVQSVRESYLHFNRVDSYRDFPNADHDDGAQLPGDRPGNAAAQFQRAPSFTAATYYDRSRSRTYAYCISLEDTPELWNDQAAGATRGKVGLFFSFGKLRAFLSELYKATALAVGDQPIQQLFSLNYGVVQYVDRALYRANEQHLANPIIYTYLKDVRFHQEAELRIALSAPGIGQFNFNGKEIGFPPSLRFPFPYRDAMRNGSLMRVDRSADCDLGWLRDELAPTGIEIAG